MAPQNLQAGKKRRADGPPNSRHAPKRRKPDIPIQRASKDEINITNFVKAREFEINALERNMREMRKSLSSRAFQQVPRHMRRRTASHNVKKVPRRLRKRALREMKDDNTPTVSKRTRMVSRKLRLRLETAKSLQKLNQRSKTVRQKKREAKAGNVEIDPENKVEVSRIPRIKKNTLAKTPTATTKYKKRQVNKTWLPTHLWHTKRAHMTRPIEPLWRLAIPLRPTEKSYRPTHRAAETRGCIAWDTSYMSTVSCRGTEHTLNNLLKVLGFEPARDSGGKSNRWRRGTRFAEGYIHEVDGTKRLLGPASVIWTATADETQLVPHQSRVDEADTSMADTTPRSKKSKLDRTIFVRVHPSCFKDFWVELLKASKNQKPQVLVEDLRFEIGSIHITGPASTESLLGVLMLRQTPSHEDRSASLWPSLAGLSNPGALPDRALLPIDIVDPRLSHPPKQIKVPSDPDSLNRLTELICTWPPDQKPTPMSLASHKARWKASTWLPSQKSINRRRTLAGPGIPLPVIDKDPSIPALLLSHRSPCKDSNAQGSWTVLLPWGCVDAVWRSLMYYTISSGNTPRFGGLYQTQQIAFEQIVPWFPADMPGTEAGKAWERTQSETRFDAWIKRPPSRRLRWELVDLGMGRTGELGRGWCCDWEFLFQDTADNKKNVALPAPDSSDVPVELDHQTGEDEERTRRRNTSSPETTPEPDAKAEAVEPDYYQLTPSQATAQLDSSSKKSKAAPALGDTPALAAVSIRLLTKGTPAAGARIYRLPRPEPGSARPQPEAASAAPNESNVNGPSAPQPTPRIPPSLPSSAIPYTSTHPSNTSSSSHAPPPAQHTPLFATSSIHPSTASAAFEPPPTHRGKWLSLVPPTFYTASAPATAVGAPLHKTRTNARSLPKKHTTHPAAPDAHALSQINVLPKNATPAIIAAYGAPPRSDADAAAWAREELLRELARGDAPADGHWDVRRGLVECPDQTDLIGFVTSGGYNLAVGRGTAVGSVWAQRVREGWAAEDLDEDREQGKDGGTARARRRRERMLCVVRNAGESVGRLAVWEACG